MSFAENMPSRDGKILLRDDQSEDLLGNWQMQVRGVLRKKKVLNFVEREEREVNPETGEFVEEVGKPKAPEPTTGRNSKAWKAWKDKRDEAAAVIVERLDPDQYVHIKGIDDDPLAMWEALAKYHTVKGLGSVVSVYKRLMGMRKDDVTTIPTHVKSIRKLAGLLESLVNFERTYGKGMPPTLVPGDGLSTNAMIARNRRPLSEVICYRCGKKGHFQSNCPELPPAGSNPARTLVATTSAPEVAELTQYYGM
ncbi:hypothetical protein C8R42DRAFT_671255 [Lentinula raphanica]|nr:hypothetical protein C8R42DRAFT_671255 [Lentinula raphanica]